MNIYVTGFHRAGTHSVAKNMARAMGIPYVEESTIKWDSLEMALDLLQQKITNQDLTTGKIYKVKYPILEKGFVLQCPGLAHETEELSKHGQVFWVTRDRKNIITSMRNAGINEMAWHIMKGFRQKFPDDEIWETLKYDGSHDVHCGFVGYYTILCKVKEYFYTKYLHKFAKKIEIEKQPYYNMTKTMTLKKPLKEKELKMMGEYAGICLH